MINFQAGTATSCSTPNRNRNRPRSCTEINDFGMYVVPRTMHEFYLHEKTLPTVKDVLSEFQDYTGYKEKASSLTKIFKALRFRWRKTRDNRRILVEKHVRCARMAFLRAVTNVQMSSAWEVVILCAVCLHSSCPLSQVGVRTLGVWYIVVLSREWRRRKRDSRWS